MYSLEWDIPSFTLLTPEDLLGAEEPSATAGDGDGGLEPADQNPEEPAAPEESGRLTEVLEALGETMEKLQESMEEPEEGEELPAEEEPPEVVELEPSEPEAPVEMVDFVPVLTALEDVNLNLTQIQTGLDYIFAGLWLVAGVTVGCFVGWVFHDLWRA